MAIINYLATNYQFGLGFNKYRIFIGFFIKTVETLVNLAFRLLFL